MEKEYSRKIATIATAFLYFFFLALLYYAFFASNNAPMDFWKQHLSNLMNGPSTQKIDEALEDEKSLKFEFEKLVGEEDRYQLESRGFACHSALHAEVCVANTSVTIDTQTMVVHVASNQNPPLFNPTLHPEQLIVRPYPRKDDNITMKVITPVYIHLENNLETPACKYTYHVPAVIFSTGGFVGNQFHEFNEIIIPLFLSSRQFKSHVQFIMVDYYPPFVTKYRQILSKLSNYEVLNPTTNGSVHCFKGAVIGLHFHNHLSINYTEIPIGYSMLDFKQFLREAYNLNTWTMSGIKKPVLVLVSRTRSRMFVNEDRLVQMMKELGFKVIVTRPDEMSILKTYSRIMNSCSVMVGVHGAGLTHELFLPTGAVLVQVVPLGLSWPSSVYYGEPTKAIGVHYLEYRIEPKESSLFELYGGDSQYIRDPDSIFSKGYFVGRAVYLEEQQVNIDLARFRETLVEAHRLLGTDLN